MIWGWLRARLGLSPGAEEASSGRDADAHTDDPYRGSHAPPPAEPVAGTSLTAGRAAAALIDFDYEAALASAADDPQGYATVQWLELQRFEAGPHLLPFDLRSSVVGGIGGGIVVAELFAFGERDCLVLPHDDPARRRLDSLWSLWLPSLERLRDPEFRARLRRARGLEPGVPSEEGVLRLELGRDIHRALLRAREEGELHGERLVETLRLLDLLLGYVGRDPNELALPELELEWAQLPEQTRARVAEGEGAALEAWERGEGVAPAAMNHSGASTWVRAYASKSQRRWYAAGMHERISRLEFQLDPEGWSLTRSDLWTRAQRG